MKKGLTVKDIKHALGVSEDIIYSAIKDKDLRYDTKGQRGIPYTFTTKQVEKWIGEEFKNDNTEKRTLLNLLREYKN